VSYCVILNDYDNIIVTNGVVVLRSNSMDSLYILFSNILRVNLEFSIGVLRPGIMASLTDQDIGNILVNTDENVGG
jgi:hypothetical protein